MPRHLKKIGEISPESKNWTIKVVVVEKGIPKVSWHRGKKYQNLILKDP